MSTKANTSDARKPEFRTSAQHATRTDPPWTSTLISRILQGLCLIVCTIIQCICAIVISQYNPSHSMKGKERFRPILGFCERIYYDVSYSSKSPMPNTISNSSKQLSLRVVQLPKYTNDASLPDSIVDPSASTFVNAVMIYASSVLISYNLAGDGQQIDRFLAVGVLSGIFMGVVSTPAGASSTLQTLKDFLPVSITVTLIMGHLWQSATTSPTT